MQTSWALPSCWDNQQWKRVGGINLQDSKPMNFLQKVRGVPRTLYGGLALRLLDREKFAAA